MAKRRDDEIFEQVRTVRKVVRQLAVEMEKLAELMGDGSPMEMSADMARFLSLLVWRLIRVDGVGCVTNSEIWAAVNALWASDVGIQKLGLACGFAPVRSNRGYQWLRERIADLADRVVNNSGVFKYYGLSLNDGIIEL